MSTVSLSDENFVALVEYYLQNMQTALEEFSNRVRSDTDFLDTELPVTESICSDLMREVGRCVEELQDINAQVQPAS